jgi:hypothetical protein
MGASGIRTLQAGKDILARPAVEKEQEGIQQNQSRPDARQMQYQAGRKMITDENL